MRPSNKLLIWMSSIGLILGISVGLSVGCYRASVQKAVYERMGCYMSTWEVFWGARPIMRMVKEAEE